MKCKYIRIIFLCFLILLYSSICFSIEGKATTLSPTPSPTSSPYKKELLPKLNVSSLSMVKKSKFTLRTYNTDKTSKITFKTSNKKVVSLGRTKKNNTTILRARGVGTATVTATIKTESSTIFTIDCTVTVGPPAISIKFKKSNVRMTVGKNKRIAAIVKPGNTTELPLYTSSNPVVAKVSANGTVTILSPGKAIITATIQKGRSASYTITAISDVENEVTPTPLASTSPLPLPTYSSQPTATAGFTPTPSTNAN